MNKKLIATISLIALLSLGSVTTFAQTATTSGKQLKALSTQEDKISARKIKADAEIDRRINSLNNLITKVNAMKKLSVTSKATLTNQIQTEITSLTALKTKIDADTDLTTLNTDIQSIVADFRVYALFIPKVNIFAGSDLVLEANDLFANIQAQLQVKITAAQSSGQDVTTLQTSLTDMQSKVADATLQANNALTLVSPLVPDKTTNYTATLQAARADLQNAKKDLVIARQDAQKIIQGLKAPKTSSSSSSSATIQ